MPQDEAGVTAQAPRLASLGVDSHLITQCVADAYRDAVLTGVNMRRALELLESLRAAAAKAGDCFDVFDAVDEQVGLCADNDQISGVLHNLRETYKGVVIAGATAEVEESLARDRESGWRQYTAAMASAIARQRMRVALAIARVRQPEPPADPMLARMDEWIKYIEQQQFGYLTEFLKHLAEMPGPGPDARAGLLILAGRVEAYNSEDGGAAEELLHQAEQLAPGNAALFSAYGEYWFQLNKGDKAREAFSRAIELNPGLSNAYSGLGDLLKRENNLTGAEEQYERAVRAQPGYTTGYASLIELYGRPELFKDRVDRLRLLVRRVIVVEPDAATSTYVSAGMAFQQNGQYEEAHAYYDKAIEADRNRPDGYTSAARAYAERREYDQAAKCLRKAVEIAPNLASPHWEFGMLHEQRKRWADALESYQQALNRPSPWGTVFATLAAEMKWKLTRHREAESDLLALLQQHPKSSSLLSKLHDFAARRYKELDDSAAAHSLLDRIREIKGAGYEPDYHNRLGNMYYYSSGYAQAVEEYTLACGAAPDESVYHSNLGVAHKALHEWEKARRKFADAFAISRNQAVYDQAMADLLKAEGDAHYARAEYAEALGLYRAASELQPKSGTYLSAIGSALEQLKTPDRHGEEIAAAIEALRAAQELDGGDNYQDRIAKLEDRHLLMELGYADFAAEPPASTPILVEVGDALVPKVDARQDNGVFLYQLIPAMRSRIETDMSVTVTGVRMRGSAGIPANAFKILLNQAPFQQVTFETDAEPAVLLDAIEQVLRRNADVFMGIEEAEAVLARWTAEGSVPESVRRKMDHPGFRLGLCRLLRTLVRDRVPITDAGAILNAVAGCALEPSDMPQAMRSVRLALKDRLPGNAPGVQIIHFPPEIESKLIAGLGEGATAYNLDPHLAYEIVSEILALWAASSGPCTLVVREPMMRQIVYRLSEYRLPGLPVLAEEELIVRREASGA